MKDEDENKPSEKSDKIVKKLDLPIQAKLSRRKEEYVAIGAALVILGFLAYQPQYVGTFIIVAAVSVIALGIIWIMFAPREIFWNFVQESTGKIAVRGGAFRRAFIQMAGYTYDKSWNVVPEDERHRESWHIGGLRLNGIPFFDNLFRFNKKRVSYSLEQGFGDEMVSSFSVKTEQFKFTIEQAETKPPEKARMDIDVIFKGKIVNPYKFFFGSPDNAINKGIESLQALFTNLIATKVQDEVFVVRNNPNMLWEEIKDDNIIKDLHNKRGFKIEENSFQFDNIRMQDSMQEAAEEQRKQQMIAAARADKMTGTLLASIANMQGKTIKEVQEEINANPQLQEVFMKIMVDLSTRQLAIDGQSFFDIRLSGAQGGEGDDSITKALVQAMTIMNKTKLGDKEKDKSGNVGKT